MTTDIIPHSRPWISDEDRASVLTTLESGMISRGKMVSMFESEVCRLVGAERGVVTASGTAAISVALTMLGVGHGDEVILPTYVCRNVLDAVVSVGATGVLCDVNDRGVITSETAGRVMSKNTKAIIAVHIFGHPCDISGLRELGLPVIEDACQAFGMTINGMAAGVIGDLGVFSFHATKCLATGEGGMVVAGYVEKGIGYPPYVWEKGGTGMLLMSDLQAALGLSQLHRYSKFVERRRRLMKLYLAEAETHGLVVGTDAKSNLPFRFTLRSGRPFQQLEEEFLKKGVVIRRGVDELLHRLAGLDDDDFPNAVELFNTTISVPFYPGLTDTEVSVVLDSFSLLR